MKVKENKNREKKEPDQKKIKNKKDKLERCLSLKNQWKEKQ